MTAITPLEAMVYIAEGLHPLCDEITQADGKGGHLVFVATNRSKRAKNGTLPHVAVSLTNAEAASKDAKSILNKRIDDARRTFAYFTSAD